MQRDRQLDRTQIGTKVPASLRNRLNQTLTQLCSQGEQVMAGQFSKLCWGLNPIKQGTHFLPQGLLWVDNLTGFDKTSS
jgi:hypothetical protein